MTEQRSHELQLPALHHVGLVVLDLADAASSFARRWGTQVTEICDITLEDALYHDRVTTISLRRGLILSSASQIELTQPLSDSPFRDFLENRKGDGVHHLAYVVEKIDPYLERLQPTCAELVLDARLTPGGGRIVLVDGFAHGPAVELIEWSSCDATTE